MRAREAKRDSASAARRRAKAEGRDAPRATERRDDD
jgi:hypothetical protein